MKCDKDLIRKNYSELFNYSKDLIFIHDLQGNLLDANERAVKAFGYNRDEISTITLSDLLIQESMDKIKEQIKKISKGNKPKKNYIFKVKTKQGDLISIVSYGIPLHKNDNIIAILNIARDISSKELTKKKLESDIPLESEKRYKFLSDQANDMVTVINNNFEYEYINEDASYRLMGYKREDILGIQAIKLVHPDDKEKIINLVKKGFKNGEASAEFRFRHKDGHWVWLESRGKTFTDNKGKIKGIIISRDITERKKTEHELKERIKELTCLQKIYEIIQDVDLSLDNVLQKIVKLIPPAWQYPEITCAKISYEDKEYKTKNFRDTKWKQSTQIHVDRKQIGTVEVCYFEERSESNNSPFLDEEWNLINNIGAILETYIKEKKSENALKRSKKRYRDLVEQAPYPILLLNFKGKILDCNKELEDLLKMQKKEVVGQKFFNLGVFIEERKLNTLKKNFKELISGNQPELIEFRIKNKENQIRWIKANSRLFRYEDVQYVQTIITDITTIKETQKLKDQLNRELEKKVQERTKELEKANKLIRRKLNFEKVISKISSRFVGTIDLDKEIIATLEDLGDLSAAGRVYIFIFNDKETMSNEYEWCAEGVSPEKDNLQNLPKSMFPWWMKRIEKGDFIHIKNVSNLPPEASTEKEMLEVQGVKSILVYPLYVEDKLHGFIGYDNVEDTRKWERSMLTSLKIVSEIIGNKLENQQALKRQNLYLEQVTKASQFKSQFMACMSHELRTPLNSIIGFTDLLLEQEYGKMEKSQIEFLENISLSSQHLLNLIDEILDISKIESGTMELQIEDISIKPFINSIISEFTPILKEKGLKMQLNGIEKPKIIQADPIKLRSIFNNLLSNAIKFTINGTISIDFNETEKFWEFNIKDTGIGIKNEDYDKVFKEFKRVESPYISNSEGTGLGLPLTRRIVNLHGGGIWFESEPGKGTNFFFTLPKTRKTIKKGKIQAFLEKL